MPDSNNATRLPYAHTRQGYGLKVSDDEINLEDLAGAFKGWNDPGNLQRRYQHIEHQIDQLVEGFFDRTGIARDVDKATNDGYLKYRGAAEDVNGLLVTMLKVEEEMLPNVARLEIPVLEKVLLRHIEESFVLKAMALVQLTDDRHGAKEDISEVAPEVTRLQELQEVLKNARTKGGRGSEMN